MRIVEMEVNGKKITFVNDSRSTRHGFAHDSTMFVNGYHDAKASCHYLNRTWEWYTYQTSMLSAVRTAMQDLENAIRDGYKYRNNISRIVGDKRKAEVKALVDASERMQMYRAVVENLTKHCYS